MKNRERFILQANEYDLLTKIQERLIKDRYTCILDLITNKVHICKKGSCNDCIQQWLNAEGDE